MRPLAALATTLLLVGSGAIRSTVAQPSLSWDRFVAQFLDQYFAANPDFAVVQGRHEFDGKLPDFSRAGIDRQIAWLHDAHTRAAAFQNLPAHQQFEQNYLLAQVDSDLFWMESAQWPYRDPCWYGDSLDPQVYLTRPYAPLDQRMRAVVAYEKALPVALDQIRANLRTPMPRTYVDQDG